ANPDAPPFWPNEKVAKRALNLLHSDAASKVTFTFYGITFHGSYFLMVAQAITAGNVGFVGGLNTKKAEAAYHRNANVIHVPFDDDYGKTDAQRNALIHECVHAWRDLMGRKVPSQEGPVGTGVLTEEAMAYVAAALFTLHDVTPKGVTPGWAERARGTAVEVPLPLFAQPGKGKFNPAVPSPDVVAMWTAVMHDRYPDGSFTYPHLVARPWLVRDNDGVADGPQDIDPLDLNEDE